MGLKYWKNCDRIVLLYTGMLLVDAIYFRNATCFIIEFLCEMELSESLNINTIVSDM